VHGKWIKRQKNELREKELYAERERERERESAMNWKDRRMNLERKN